MAYEFQSSSLLTSFIFFSNPPALIYLSNISYYNFFLERRFSNYNYFFLLRNYNLYCSISTVLLLFYYSANLISAIFLNDNLFCSNSTILLFSVYLNLASSNSRSLGLSRSASLNLRYSTCRKYSFSLSRALTFSS